MIRAVDSVDSGKSGPSVYRRGLVSFDTAVFPVFNQLVVSPMEQLAAQLIEE